MLKIGIVGTGYTIGIAQMHIKAYKLLPDVQITAVYDLEPERARDYIEKFQLTDAVACQSYAQLLEKVDAVSICTPNDSHVPLSVTALQAGKHVLCEKPFSIDAASCDPAVEAAEKSSQVAMIGLCYRGIPGFAYMKHLVESGVLGEIFLVRESQGGNRIASPQIKLEWRMQKSLSGPGAVADFGSHMLDMTDYILRSRCGRIREVQCMQSTLVKQREVIGQPGTFAAVDNDDVAVFNARMESGALVSFSASRIGCDHTMEIWGSGGYVGFSGARPFEVSIQKKDLEGGYSGDKEVVAVPESFYLTDPATPKTPFLINFYHEIKEFVAAIVQQNDTEITFARGRYVQKLIDAVNQSAQTGTVVEIDFVE